MLKLANLVDKRLEVVDARELHGLAVVVGPALARLVLQDIRAAEHHDGNEGYLRVVSCLWRGRQLVVSEP